MGPSLPAVRRYLLISACFSLPCCTLWTDWFPPAAPSTVLEKTERKVAEVLPLADCPIVQHPGPQPVLPLVAVGAAALPVVVNALTDAFKTAVQQAQDDLNASYVAYGTAQLSVLPRLNRCLVILRGSIPGSGAAQISSNKGAMSADIINELRLTNYPDLYVEFWIDPDPINKQRLILEPVFLQFSDTAALNPGNGKKEIGLVLALSGTPLTLGAGAAASDIAKASTASVAFDLGMISRGTWIRSDPALVGKPGDIFLEQRRAVSLADSASKTPVGTFDLYAFISESAKPGVFYKVLIDTSADSSLKDALTTIGKGILPAAPAAK